MAIHVQLGDNCIVFEHFTASIYQRSNQKDKWKDKQYNVPGHEINAGPLAVG